MTTGDGLRDRPVSPDLLVALRSAGALRIEAFREAAWWIARPPPATTWRRILDPLALVLGITFLVSGVLYLVAFNWSELGRFSKIAVGLAPVAVVGIAAAIAGTQRLTGKVLATAGIPLTLGALLAVALAYPTKGSSWTLLAIWAGLSIPWAIASRLAPSWLGVLLAIDLALLSIKPNFASDPAHLDAVIAGIVGVHAVAWLSMRVAGWARVPGAWVWVRETVLAPVLIGLAFWPLEAITVNSTAETAEWTLWDPFGLVLYVLVGIGIHVGFAFGRVRPFPAAVQLLTLLAVVTAGMARVLIEMVEGLELAGLFLTLPLGLVLLVQLSLSSAWLVWGWRRGLKRAPAEDRPRWRVFGEATDRGPRPTWWPRLGPLVEHLKGEALLDGEPDEDLEADLLAAVEAQREPSPWYLKGALFGGGLLAGGVLACTCGPLATLSSGVAFLLPAVVLGVGTIGVRLGRPLTWAEWLDPLLFALMVAAQLLLGLGLALTIGEVNALDDRAITVFAAVLGLIQTVLLVIYPDRWYRTLGTIVLCGCFAGLSYDLELWPIRDVGTGLAVLFGAVIIASRPVFSGTPLRELLGPVGLGFAAYGLGGMGRFWRGWANEGWILIVGICVGVLATLVVGWTLSRVRAPAHGWVVGLLATVLLVLLGTSMPALPVALCFLLLGLLSRDAVVVVGAILAIIAYGAWAYTAFDWPIGLKAAALLGSGVILLGLRGYLRAVIPANALESGPVEPPAAEASP